MRRRELLRIWAVAICLSVAAGTLLAQQGLARPWDPAAHLAATWQHARISRLVNNPQAPPQAWTPDTLSVSLGASVVVTDPNGLIALSAVPTDILVLGGSIIGATPGQEAIRGYRPIGGDDVLTVMRSYVPIGHTSTINVNTGEISLDPLVPFATGPGTLDRIEWSLFALASDRIEQVDLPFASTSEWAELSPGVLVRVNEAEASATGFMFAITTSYDKDTVTFSPDRNQSSRHGRDPLPQYYAWSDPNLPSLIVTDIEVVDADGNAIHGLDGETEITAFGGAFAVTHDGTDSSDAAWLRFTLAYDPYEVEARFGIEDIPLLP